MTKNGSNDKPNAKRIIDGDKLYEDLCARFANLKHYVDNDINGDPARYFHQWWEVKYWKEAFERGVYDYKEDA